MISLLSLILIITGIASGYFLGCNLLNGAIADHRRGMTGLIATAIDAAIENEVSQITVLSTSPVWIKAIEKSNSNKGSSPGTESLDMDLAARLRYVMETDRNIREIFITDKSGGLVAASGKPDKFYYADEDWWQRAFDKGRGKAFISDIKLDESTNAMDMIFAVPIKNKEGEVIGLCKAVADATHFFRPMKGVRLGKTGCAVLVDGSGNVLFFDNKAYFYKELFKGKDPASQSNDRKRAFHAITRYANTGRLYLTGAALSNPALLRDGMAWQVFICQDESEVLAPIRALILQLGLLCGLLLVVFLIIGYIFGGIITAPILKLREGIERIGRGELDSKIDIKTGDELEQLADSFNKMTEDLKRTTISISILNSEIDARKTAEERLRAAHERLKQFQSQLVHAAKMGAIGQLAAGAAHEIGNPMSVISGEAEMLLTDANKDDRTRNTMKVILEQVKRVDGIMERLLSFSRKREPAPQSLSVNEIIEESIRLVGYQFKLQDVEIIKDLAKGLPEVLADANQLKEVFINIMLNAFQSIGDKGELRIRAYEEDAAVNDSGRAHSLVVAEFTDTGKGMDQETLDSIFEPFFSTKDYGIGLGLFVCYGIIKNCGGNIEAYSKPGEGATFTVKLPAQG